MTRKREMEARAERDRVRSLIKVLLEKKLRVLLYFGDILTCVSFVGPENGNWCSANRSHQATRGAECFFCLAL